MPYEMPVTATDIWYYFICKRESWLMSHRIAPDEEDENVEIGRFIHEYRYSRGKRELDLGAVKIDRIIKVKRELVIREIKKSSRFLESARFQLLYYLDLLRNMGIIAKGELVFPEERDDDRMIRSGLINMIHEKALKGKSTYAFQYSSRHIDYLSGQRVSKY